MQLNRNQELLEGLLLFSEATVSLMWENITHFESPLNLKTTSGCIVNGISNLFTGIWQALQESQLVYDLIKLGAVVGFVCGALLDYAANDVLVGEKVLAKGFKTLFVIGQEVGLVDVKENNIIKI